MYPTISLPLVPPPGSRFSIHLGDIAKFDIARDAAKLREAIEWFRVWIDTQLVPIADEEERLAAKRAEWESDTEAAKAKAQLDALMAQIPATPEFDPVRAQVEKMMLAMPKASTVLGTMPAESLQNTTK